MSAYSIEALIEAQQLTIKSLIKTRRDLSDENVQAFNDTFNQLSTICDSFIKEAQFQTYLNELRNIIATDIPLKNKFENPQIYILLKRMENSFVDLKYKLSNQIK